MEEKNVKNSASYVRGRVKGREVEKRKMRKRLVTISEPSTSNRYR